MYVYMYMYVYVYVYVHVYEQYYEILCNFESAGWGMIRSETKIGPK